MRPSLGRNLYATIALGFLLASAGGLAGAESRAQSFGDALKVEKAKDIRPQDVIRWEGVDARPLDANRIEVSARMTATSGWSIYKKNLEFSGPAGFTVESVKEPPSQRIVDPVSGEEVDVYAGGDFFVTLAGPVDSKRDTFQLNARYVGCTKVICLFPHTETMFAVISQPATTTVPAAAPDPSPAAGRASSSDGEDLESRLARQLSAGEVSFGLLLVIVFAGGLLSNLTPCVYPMIPITLRLLARQGASAYLSASAYALGIVVTYSALGIFAALSGSLFGSLLASKTFNLTFAVIMAVLGLTMLGFGNLARLQSLGSRLGSGKPSPANAFLMGTGAGLVAAPCTGPILAALLAYTTKNNAGLGYSVALLFTYSMGFALPYIALGGAAAKVSQVKVPPSVQIATKLLFASVMFALALYYLRIPLYQQLQAMRPFWQPLALGGLAVGLLLSGVWVILPALQMSKVGMILPTTILGVGVFASSQALTSSGTGGHATWLKTEAEAFAAAESEGKPVLIDMWAEWCEACKKMDVTTFADPVVQAALASGWITLKLDLTEDTPENTATQEKYGLQSLPTLVIVAPGGKEGGVRKNITGYVGSGTLLDALKAFKAELPAQKN